MLIRFINDICEILDIPVPEISYDTSHFQTETMIAQCHSSGNVIHIKKVDVPNADILFAIAHELRHIYQIRNDYEFFLADYKTRSDVDLETYNNQIAEIDANAFATIVMVDLFHLNPQFTGLSSVTIKLIKERIDEIIETFE